MKILKGINSQNNTELEDSDSNHLTTKAVVFGGKALGWFEQHMTQ